MKPELTSSPSIYIVLSTFEGGAHVREQIESIFAQSHADWRMLVRDDGSADETIRHLEELAGRDVRLEILRDDLGHLGGDGSFSLLLKTALARGADWIAISDQDDVWKREKLARQIARLDESGARPEESVLLHSDLEVVGADLGAICPSLHRLMRLRHEQEAPLATLLVQNFVTGCTCVVSRALLDRALPIPRDAIVYDWWLALCAGSYGRIVFDSDSTVLYRQHSGNQIGVKPYPRALMKLMAKALRPRRHSSDEFLDTIRQACALKRHLIRLRSDLENSPREDRAGNRGLEEACEFVSAYLAVYSRGMSRFQRVRELSRLRVRRQDLILNASLKLKLLLTPIELPSNPEDAEPFVRRVRRHAGS